MSYTKMAYFSAVSGAGRVVSGLLTLAGYLTWSHPMVTIDH